MKKIFIVAMIVMIGLVYWWADSNREKLVNEPEDPAAESGLIDEAEAEGLGESPAAQETDSAGFPQSQSQRRQSDGTRTLLVRVVMDEDQSPVEGAKIYFLQSADVDREALEEMGMDRLDPAELFRKFARQGLTDERGEWQVEWDGEEGGAFAESDGMQSGFESTNSMTAEVMTLTLVEERGVTVQVVDGLGAPMADVPVSLRVRADDPYGDEPMEMTMFTRRTRASDGKVSFSGIEGMLSFDNDPDPDYLVRLEVPGADPVQELVAMERMQDVVVLVLPDVGRLQLEIVDANGERILADGNVELMASGRVDLNAGGEFQPMLAIQCKSKLSGGQAEFQWVGLDKKLRAQVSIPSLGMDWTTAVTGPDRPGQTSSVQLTAPRSPTISGRLLLPDGTPAVRRRGSLVLNDANGLMNESGNFRTDSNGRFIHQVGKPAIGKELRLNLTCYGGIGRTYFVRSDDLLTLSSTGLDLGDLPMQPAFREIRGRCVDPEGNGVGGFLIFAQRADGIQSGVNVAADGSFRFDGTFEQNTLLTLQGYGMSPWVLPEPVAVEVDGEAVKVIVFPAGSIEGVLEMPAEHDYGDLSIYAVATSGGSRDRDGVPVRTHATVDAKTGQFRVANLDQGLYDLQLKDRGGSELARMEGISVQYGQTTSDPRLQPWRFQLQVHQALIRLVQADGQPVLNASANYYRDGKHVGQAHAPFGELKCWYGNPESIEILLQADGFRPQWLPGTTADTTITMEAGIEIQLQCDRLPALKFDDHSIELSLQWENDDPRLKHVARVSLPNSFAATGSCTLILPGPGYFQPMFRTVSVGSSSFSFTEEETVQGSSKIYVSDKDHGKTIHLTLPESILE